MPPLTKSPHVGGAAINRLFDLAPDLLCVIARTGAIEHVNPAFEHTLGWREDALVSSPLIEFVHPDDRAVTAVALDRLQDAIAPVELEHRFRSRSGDYRRLSWRMAAGDGDGSAYAVARDVTQRRGSEEALRVSEARHRGFIEAAHEGVWALDAVGRTTYVNPRMAELLGCTAAELLGRSIFDCVAPSAVLDARDRLAREQLAVAGSFAMAFRCHTGEELLATVSASALRDGEGRFCGVLALVTDVTAKRRAEVALRASERFNDALLDASLDCVQLLDLDGRLEHVNAQGRRLLECTDLTPHLGTDWVAFWTAEARQRARDAVDAARAGGTGRFEGGCPTCTGSPKLWDVTVTPVRDDAGRIIRLLAVWRDVTDAKAAQERLRASEERYRSLTTSSPVGIVETDAHGHFTYANHRSLQLWGLRDAEILGRGWMARVHPDDLTCLTDSLFSAIAAARECEAECRLLLPDGGVRWVRGRAAPRRDGAGTVVGMVGTIEDITAQRFAARQLEESEERHRSLFDNHPDAVYLLDPSGRFLRANPACEMTVEYKPGQLVGQLFDPLLVPEHREVARRHFAAAVGGSAQQYEIEVQHESGRRVALAITNIPVRVDGNVVGVFGIAKDVSAHRALEAQLRQAQKMEAVGRLAGGIAHDFNNLLTVITSYTMMLLTELPNADPLRQDLEEIQAATDRATGLTRQLLAFSRQQVLNPRVIDLPRVIGEMENLLRRLIREDIQFTVSGVADPAHVHADPGQIEQVVMNLAVNARDAMPAGGALTIMTDVVTLAAHDARRIPSVEPGEYVRIRVRDTGCGMDEQTKTRVFEPFYTTKEPGKGTGLGLATVHGIVEQSGGSVHVDSAPGAGTTFEVFLPRVAPPSAPDVVEPQVTAVAVDQAVTVLLVEDEDALRAIMQRVLRKRGYTVISARNGPDALLEVERQAGPIHLLITDVVMPKMSGQDLARLLTERCGELPVLFMSGYSMEAVANHGMLRPGARLLNKPFKPHDLALAASELLNAHHGLMRTDEHPALSAPHVRAGR